MSPTHKRIMTSIFVFWGLMYLVYPSWLLPLDPVGRFSILGGFILYFLLNGVLLVRWVKRTSLPREAPKRHLPLLRSRWGLAWICLALLSVLLHLYPLGFPIRGDDDEHYHVTNALTLKERVEGVMERVSSEVGSFSGGKVIVGIGGGLFLAFLAFGKWLGKRSKTILGVTLGLILMSVSWQQIVHESYMQGLLHYPPLAKLLNLGVYVLLGVSEFKIRIVPLAFSILTSFFIFKITALYRPQATAFISALLILFLPNCFYYAGVAELGAGTLFFMVLLAYLGLVVLQGREPVPFLWFILAGGAAFFYHRMAIMMLGILLVFFIWMRLYGKCDTPTLRRWIGATYFALVPILLWLLIDLFLNIRNYEVTLTNFIRPEVLLRYLLQGPTQIGYPLFLLFLGSLFWAFFRKKDPLSSLCIIWFLLAYLFLTADSSAARLQQIGFPRYGLVLYGPVAILIADVFGRLFQKLGPWGGRLAIGVLLGSLLSVSTVMPMPPVEARYTTFLQREESDYAIYEEAIPFMMRTLPEGTKIFDTRGSDYFKFYLKKYGPAFVWNRGQREAETFEPRTPGTALFLYRHCRKEGFRYVFCGSEVLSKGRFRLVKVFGNGERKRYLWEVL